MNNKQRKQLAASLERLKPVQEKFNNIKSELEAGCAEVSDILGDIEAMRDEEKEKFENMPEGLQAGERGQILEEAIESLEEIMNTLEDMVECADEFDAADKLQTAIDHDLP